MQTRKQGERQFRRIKYYNIPTTNTVYIMIDRLNVLVLSRT